jgi:hypothetical protein
MRFRTAALLSTVLIAVMYGFPAAVKAVFLPSLAQGIPDPVPVYEQILLGSALWCARFSWLLAPPILLLLFATASLTSTVRAMKGSTAARGIKRPTEKRRALG